MNVKRFQRIVILLIIAVLVVPSIITLKASAVSIKCGISVEGRVTGNLDDAPLPKSTSSFYSDESPCFSLVVDKELYINYAELVIYKNGSEYTRTTRTPDQFRFCNVQYNSFSAGSYTYKWSCNLAYNETGPYNNYNFSELSFTVSNPPKVSVSRNKSLYANGETASFIAKADYGKTSLKYQWYKSTVSSGALRSAISGATSAVYSVTANDSSKGYYYFCMVSDGERAAESSRLYLDCDTSNPTVSLSSTNDVASSQTVTINMSDNVGIKGYYWGTSPTYSNNSYFSTISTSVSKTVSSAGTYYVTAVDTYGNVSSTKSITFYKTTLNANEGSVSPTSVLTKSGNSFTFPTPKRDNYSCVGWSPSSSASSGVWSLTPSFNTTYYAIWSYIDTINPTVSLFSTNSVASSQTVTIKMSDNVGVKGYYWGTSSSYSNNTYTSTSSTSISKTVDSPGTYYATAVDTSGNVSSTQSITFYKTNLNANGGSVSPASVLTKYGNSFTFPTPSRSGYTYLGWATSKNAKTGLKSLKPTENETYYAAWKVKLLAAPIITGGKNTNSGLKISWDKITGAAKYRVFRRGKASTKWYTIGDTAKTSFTDKSVRDMNTFYYTVGCVSSDGKELTSLYDTKGRYYLYTATPEMISAVSGRSGVNVKWKMLSDRYYYVYRRTGSNSKWEKIAEVQPNVGGNYTDKKVKSGVKYSYTVRSKSQMGTSAYDKNGKTLTYIAPPVLKKITNTKNGVSLTWGKVAGAAKYRVFRRVGTGGKWAIIKDIAGLSYVDKTSKKGVKYQYTIRCISKDGKAYTSDYKTLGTITCKR